MRRFLAVFALQVVVVASVGLGGGWALHDHFTAPLVVTQTIPQQPTPEAKLFAMAFCFDHPEQLLPFVPASEGVTLDQITLYLGAQGPQGCTDVAFVGRHAVQPSGEPNPEEVNFFVLTTANGQDWLAVVVDTVTRNVAHFAW